MMACTLFTNSQVRSPGSDPFFPDSERPKNGHQKKHMCYNEIGLCTKYINHSKFNSEHKHDLMKEKDSWILTTFAS